MAKKTVKPGESFSKISQQIDIPEEELRRQNPGVKTLKPGQVIKVPRQENFQTPPTNGFTAAQPFTPPASPIPPVNPIVPDGRRGRPGEVNQPVPSAGQQIINTYSQMTPANLLDAFVSPFRAPSTDGGRRQGSAPSFAGGNLGGGFNTQAPQTNLAYYNSSYRGFQTPTSSAPRAQPYTGTAGYGMQPKPSQANFRTPTTNGFQAQPQPFLGSAQYLDPRYQAQANTQATQQPIARPDAPYTGNPDDPNTALWKNYWNAAAQNPSMYAGQAQPPQVMTREQIWNMKADQRRKRMEAGDVAPVEQQQPGQPQYQDYSNPELRRSITWGI